MAVDKTKTTSTTTTLPPLSSFLGGPSGSTGSKNPTSQSQLVQGQVSGVGSLLGLKWGNVSVATAVTGLEELAKKANGHDAQAQQAATVLAGIKHDMWLAGLYGRNAPAPDATGHITVKDEKAFQSLAEGASGSGTPIGDYLSSQATTAQQQGTGGGGGGGTHIIPPRRVQERVFGPNDILAAVNGATDANGENLAQKLIGRNFTPQELQSVADSLNQNSANQANADAAGILQQQQEQISTQQAINAPPNTVQSQLPGQPSPTGTMTHDQLAQLWVQAGGDPRVASNMANIAIAESGGNPGNNNYTDNGGKQTSWGLWQVSDGTHNAYAGNMNDPLTNAKAAVAKYKSGGYGPWRGDANVNMQGQYIGPTGPPPNAGNPNAQQGTSGAFIKNLSPVGPGLTQGRVDQGVDFSGKGSLFAVGDGTILSIKGHPGGWPGLGTFIALKLDHPVDPAHSIVYYAEDIVPGVAPGQRVKAGQIVGMATGGNTGIEIGWGDPTGAPQALAATTGHSGQKDQPGGTPEGQAFLNFIGGSASVSGSAYGGNQGQTLDIYQQPVIDQVPANLDATAAAEGFAQQLPEFQKNNLLRTFDQIQKTIGQPGDASQMNVHVRQTPVTTK